MLKYFKITISNFILTQNHQVVDDMIEETTASSSTSTIHRSKTSTMQKKFNQSDDQHEIINLMG